MIFIAHLDIQLTLAVPVIGEKEVMQGSQIENDRVDSVRSIKYKAYYYLHFILLNITFNFSQKQSH